jgi:hypothetical protein
MVALMSRFVGLMAMVLGVSLNAFAQDPTKTLPESYKVEMDNDYVTVVRVHYDAGAKLPEHTHSGGTTAYVYLNDSEGVVFSHVGGSNRAVTRPPVMREGIKQWTTPPPDFLQWLDKGTTEEFAVTGDFPVDIIRIEFLTKPKR